MRKFQSGRSADSATVAGLMKTYGELDGEIVYHLATNFAQVGQSLTADQKAELMALRTKLLGDLATPAGAYLFSQPIATPDIPNTDFLFGVAAAGPTDPGKPADPDEPPASDFPDIASSPYGAAIEAMAARGVIGGYTDGTFRPDESVKRMQFAKMVVKTLNYPVSAADTCLFADVPQGSDASDPLYPRAYVAVCAVHGITEGVTSATFDPYGTITRAQLITMVARAARSGRAPIRLCRSVRRFLLSALSLGQEGSLCRTAPRSPGRGSRLRFLGPRHTGGVRAAALEPCEQQSHAANLCRGVPRDRSARASNQHIGRLEHPA